MAYQEDPAGVVEYEPGHERVPRPMRLDYILISRREGWFYAGCESIVRS